MYQSVVAAFAATALLLAGCTQPQSKETVAGADGSKVTVSSDNNGNKVEIQAAGAGGGKLTFGTGGSWPAAFASIAPAYPGAQIETSAAGTGDAGTGAMVVFSTADPADKVVAFYKGKATGAGMTPGMEMANGDTRMFTAASGSSKQSITVQTSTENGATKVMVMMGTTGG